MPVRLPDGRTLMAAYEDLDRFFKENRILGKTILDIRPFCFDYLRGIFDQEQYEETFCGISTDSQICLLFCDASHLELEFSGDGPILLGYNTADFSKYSIPNGSCFTLRTMFRHSLYRRIVGIHFEKSSRKMLFPCYRGINMAAEDDGIKEIRFLLDDGTSLVASGSMDFFDFEHRNANGELLYIPEAELRKEVHAPPYNKFQ